MNNNWNRLKRKLKPTKRAHSNSNWRRKRRKLNVENSSTSPSAAKAAHASNGANESTDETNKSFVLKYQKSSSSNPANDLSPFEAQIEKYRNSTAKKQLFECIDLVPPASTNHDLERRKLFWNDVRLKLRARLPKEFLFKLIPHSHQTQQENNAKKSGKLHKIQPSTKHTDIVAMDCEMVGMGRDGHISILARVSIVNYHGDVLYDKFVQPIGDPKCSKITDFREDITGITKHDLLAYGIPFEQCQQELIELLTGKTIIGQAIDNDFAAIKCSGVLRKRFYQKQKQKTVSFADEDGEGEEEEEDAQKAKLKGLSKRKLKGLQYKKVNLPWCFDTAKCELLHDDLMRPRSLKFLLELFLGVHIQNEEHDSVIDAISTMAIYRAILPEVKEHLKMKKKQKEELEEKQKRNEQRREEAKARRAKIAENRSAISNYAYNNDLDRLLEQFDARTGCIKDNFDAQLLSNPYK